ncbi:hypothetical protein ILYODFUR_035772 [Ilyodon furcidens]|uniref:Interleukin-6 n=1 Tax=Ilyodon furcidens TaxID=33524 RepID=A0ABV0T684_9TELE
MTAHIWELSSQSLLMFYFNFNKEISIKTGPAPPNLTKLLAQPETDSILEESRTAVHSRMTGLLHYLKRCTERLEQGSF